MKKNTSIFLLLFFFSVQSSYAAQTLVSVKVDQAPVLDGLGNDRQWEHAEEISTVDTVAEVPISLKAVHTQSTLFFLITFPDLDESRLHKPWVWDSKEQFYRMGPQREDTFVIKWPLDPAIADFSLTSEETYKADIWFWKANRTDPAGFADDKFQRFSAVQQPKSMKLQSKLGKPIYMQRSGDEGQTAYRAVLHLEYEGEILPQFHSQQPSGGRADILARGVWKNGGWSIEFSRPLQTGDADDIQLELNRHYIFGVSRYEIAGRKPDKNMAQPLYGTGDVSEQITLQFGQ